MSGEYTDWQASQACPNNATCLEVQWWQPVTRPEQPGLIILRDSTDPEGPTLEMSPAEWDAFLQGVKAGEFDGPRTT